MRKGGFSEEQIIAVLKAAGTAQRKSPTPCRKHGINEHTFYRSRAKSVIGFLGDSARSLWRAAPAVQRSPLRD
jgi:hypothetical protein